MNVKESDFKYDSHNYGCELKMSITHIPTDITVKGDTLLGREELKNRLELELRGILMSIKGE